MHISECPLESCSFYSPSTPAVPLIPWEAEHSSRYFQIWSVLTRNSTVVQQAEVQKCSDLVNSEDRPNPEQFVLFGASLAVAALRMHGLECGMCVC